MRPVRGMSNRAPLKPQSKDRSLCVRRRVVSQAGKLTRAYLRNAGTYWSYERALLYRIPSWSSACHSRDKKVQLPLCWGQAAGAAQHHHSAEPNPSGGRNGNNTIESLESVLTAISVGGWSSSTQAEIHPLAKTDWRLKQRNTIALSAIVLATHVFHFGIVK